MLSVFFSMRVSTGREKFEDVPDVFKEDVARDLVDGGQANLVPPEYGGTMGAVKKAV